MWTVLAFNRTTLVVWWQGFVVNVALFCERGVYRVLLKGAVVVAEARFSLSLRFCLASDKPHKWSVLSGRFSGSSTTTHLYLAGHLC